MGAVSRKKRSSRDQVFPNGLMVASETITLAKLITKEEQRGLERVQGGKGRKGRRGRKTEIGLRAKAA